MNNTQKTTEWIIIHYSPGHQSFLPKPDLFVRCKPDTGEFQYYYTYPEREYILENKKLSMPPDDAKKLVKQLTIQLIEEFFCTAINATVSRNGAHWSNDTISVEWGDRKKEVEGIGNENRLGLLMRSIGVEETPKEDTESSESKKLQTSVMANNVITYTAKEKLKVPRADAFNVEIQSHTFANGTGIITFVGDVTTIGKEAFEDCRGLTSITIPNSVTEIGGYAFKGCTGLTSIEIPNSVKTIGYAAFYGYRGLKSPVYNANCFAYMPSSYAGAYSIPDSIKQIAGFAFFGCSGLTSIEIPNSVTTIGDWAFRGCSGLESITCYATTPPILEEFCFGDVLLSIPVYVPDEVVEAYKKTDGWKEFENILPISAKK